MGPGDANNKEDSMLFGKEAAEWASLGGMDTAAEIAQQPILWRETCGIIAENRDRIARFVEEYVTPETRIVMTGAGTSDYVGDTVVEALRDLLPCRVEAIASTDIVSAPYECIEADVPTILISYARSGNSPESMGAYDLFQQEVSVLQQLVITCDAEGELAKKAEKMENAFVLLMPEASNDKGFAMTSSYSCMLLSTLLFFDLDNLEWNTIRMERLAGTAEDFIARRYGEIDQMIGYGKHRVIYLGSGFYAGFCQEMALKNLELTSGKILTFNEGVMAFRHGPKSIINDDSLIVVFLSGNPYTRQYDMDMIDEIHGDAGDHKLVVVAYNGPEDLKAHCDQVIAFRGEEVPGVYRVFNYMLVGQMFGLFDSVAQGVTPDNPRPDGTVNRVVKGVTLHPYSGR